MSDSLLDCILYMVVGAVAVTIFGLIAFIGLHFGGFIFLQICLGAFLFLVIGKAIIG